MTEYNTQMTLSDSLIALVSNLFFDMFFLPIVYYLIIIILNTLTTTLGGEPPMSMDSILTIWGILTVPTEFLLIVAYIKK